VADEMRSGLVELLEPDGLVLEVDALDVGSGREPAPVRDDELEALLQRPLRAPRDLAVHDAAVDEEEVRAAHPGILIRRTNYAQIA
jgi:hypothetical protein